MPIDKVIKSGKEVELNRQGEDILNRHPPVRRTLAGAFDALASMPDDFFAQGRHEFSAQEQSETPRVFADPDLC